MLELLIHFELSSERILNTGKVSIAVIVLFPVLAWQPANRIIIERRKHRAIFYI
jgi:hypothetical protein